MQMNSIDLQTLHAALGGEISSGQILCPGPGHSQRDRSLAVRPTSSGFVVHSFAGDDYRECMDYVRERVGLSRWQPGDRRRDQPGIFVAHSNEDHSRIRRAQEIWREGFYPIGTVAEQYLAARKLNLPLELCGSVLRFHPRCPWRNKSGEIEFIPCLIAAFKSISDDTIAAIHRIRLDRPGLWPKTQRKMLGFAAGAAIKLDPAGQQLAVGEGLETCMAARQLGFKPVWALGSARFAKFAPLKGVNKLIILGERDEASRKAAQACADLHNQSVFLALPKGSHKDFNDLLMESVG